MKVEDITDEMKRLMIALMMKIVVLVIMDSTCYSFGGELFKQVGGAGIGLRASACMAKILMGQIDKIWASLQLSFGVILAIYLRYIDDLRAYLFPISKGWSWGETGWQFSTENEANDMRSDMTRTCDEIAKSLSSVVGFIKFTAENESEFTDNFLPTLDLQTQF